MMDEIFIRLDGDKIGDSIELALMSGNPGEAQETHDRVQKGMRAMTKFIESQPGTTLLLVGSDDILFSTPLENYNMNVLEQISDIFFQNTRFTLSIGVGLNISQALNNLLKAKLSGRNRIVGDFNS